MLLRLVTRGIVHSRDTRACPVCKTAEGQNYWAMVCHAGENLKQVEAKLKEQRVHVVEPPQTPRRPGLCKLDAAGPPSAAALSMGRAHSANTELAEISIVGSGELPAHIKARK